MKFEERFFGPGNVLRWDAIQSRTLTPSTLHRLDPFIAGLRQNDALLVLPRARRDGQTIWYVLAKSEREIRVAQDELRAFLGPSYSTLVGYGAFSKNDPVEAAVVERFGANAFRFQISNPQLADAARERLLLFLRIKLERPNDAGLRIRATGRILRDFEYALLAHDDQTAEATLAELRIGGRLDAANLLFLEIRRRVAAEDSLAVLQHPHLQSLLTMRRPRRVTEALIRAVYDVELRNFEAEVDPEGARQHFRTSVQPRFSALYSSRAGLNGTAIDASFLLLAVASTPPRHDVVTSIIAEMSTTGRTTDYLRSVAALITVLPQPHIEPPSTLASAGDAFAVNDIDRALAIAHSVPESANRAVLLLHCAFVIGALSPAREALAAFDRLPVAEQDRLLEHSRLAAIIAQLRALEVHQTAPSEKPTEPVTRRCVPQGWPEWLCALQGSDRWPAAVAVAERGAREWSYATLVADPDAVASLSELLIVNLSPWAQTALRDALPYCIEFVLSEGPDPRLRAVYDNLFLLMALDEQQSVAHVRNFVRVAEARLSLRLGEDAYRELLYQLTSALERASTPATIEVALDALEVVLWSSCPSIEARLTFTIGIGALCRQWYRWIEPGQAIVLEALARDIGVSLEVPRVGAGTGTRNAPVWDRLRHKSVALYSLQEPALRHAATALRELAPGVAVACFHDKVGGSPSLRTAAATADLFVIATSAAKHAATDFIKMSRQHKPVLYARGSGAASLLVALKEHSELE
jgi:hypothetical protein